jgi:subtilisin family serine protease
MRRIITLLFFLLVATVSATLAADLPVVDVKKPNLPSFIGYVQDEIVVKFDETILTTMKRDQFPRGQTGIFALDQQGSRFNAVSMRPLFPGAKRGFYRGRALDLAGWHKIRFAGGIDVGEVAREYKRVQGVVDAQPIGVHGVYGMPNDTNFGDQWHLNQASDADADAPEAWDLETGTPEVVVAVLDTGVRWFHKDLGDSTVGAYNLTTAGGNLWVNSAEKSGVAGTDDDGNGYVDDVVGWDFVER